jgi:4-hydroxybenzoate polyprenyltransferase
VRFGVTGALALSAASHVVTALCLAGTGLVLHRGPAYFAGVVVVSALLLWEHLLVGKGDLSKIDKAFFDLNAWVSMAFFGCTLADALLYAR